MAVAALLLACLQLAIHSKLHSSTATDSPHVRTSPEPLNTTAAGPARATSLGEGGDAPARSRIPQLVHQSWRDDGFPKDMFNFRWQDALMALNPGWRLMRWTDATSRQLIADDFPCAAIPPSQLAEFWPHTDAPMQVVPRRL